MGIEDNSNREGLDKTIRELYENQQIAAATYDFQNERPYTDPNALSEAETRLVQANDQYLAAVNEKREAEGKAPFDTVYQEKRARIRGEEEGGFPRKFD